MTPFGLFYCVFKWDLSSVPDTEYKLESLQVRVAKESEFDMVAEVWHRGLSQDLPGRSI